MVCSGTVVMVSAVIWLAVVFYSRRKAMLDHSRVGPLTWSTSQDPASYDDTGRRLLRRSERMVWGFLPFCLLMILVAHLLCPGDF